KDPGNAVLLVFDGPSTRAVKEYLESLLPGLHMEFEADPIAADGDIAYAHVDAPSAAMLERLTAPLCRGAQSEYELVGAHPEDVLVRVNQVAPYIDTATWPA